MICKICKAFLPTPAIALDAIAAMTDHIGTDHPHQASELMLQTDAIMDWLTARIFELDPDSNVAKSHEDMTGRMTKLSQSIQAEIDQAKTDRQSRIVTPEGVQLVAKA